LIVINRDMTPARWAQITDLFGDALEMRPDERAAYLVRLKNEDSERGGGTARRTRAARWVSFRSERSAATWREVAAHSVGDHRERVRRERVEKRLTSLLR
jgi:hypothetical protein